MTMIAEEMGANVELRAELGIATTLTDAQLYRGEIERLRSAHRDNITVLLYDDGPYRRGEPLPPATGTRWV